MSTGLDRDSGLSGGAVVQVGVRRRPRSCWKGRPQGPTRTISPWLGPLPTASRLDRSASGGGQDYVQAIGVPVLQFSVLGMHNWQQMVRMVASTDSAGMVQGQPMFVPSHKESTCVAAGAPFASVNVDWGVALFPSTFFPQPAVCRLRPVRSRQPQTCFLSVPCDQARPLADEASAFISRFGPCNVCSQADTCDQRSSNRWRSFGFLAMSNRRKIPNWR
jgi:hypothetical protein